MRWPLARLTSVGRIVVVAAVLAGCDREHRSDGEKLARANCAACHVFPEPRLLDKKTWQQSVLPQMGARLGVPTGSLADEMNRDPQMIVSAKSLAPDDWQKIVSYYLATAPDSLAHQLLTIEPAIDPAFFRPAVFAPSLRSSGIITLLKTDPAHQRIFIGEAGGNTLRVFDWQRRQLSSLSLASPPTDLIIDGDSILILESGILNPNDEPRGRLTKYALAGSDSLRDPRTVLDSLFRPVFVRQFDFDGDGRQDLLVCEYGNNRGRLALYKNSGSAYERIVLAPSPGAIRFEIRDITGDGLPDIVALLAQADERIVVFENDGRGGFSNPPRVLARFPPVFGSMYFSMHDFNGDGKMEIVYVNGDNFDYSRILKPYHGVRILENDGRNHFAERYFFPLYGAARAEVADFDKDGDLDIMATSNFADARTHPERGIVYLANKGRYQFQPYSFSAAAANEWNLTATGDLNGDGWLDVIVAAMDLHSVRAFQTQYSPSSQATARNPLLLFENRMGAR